jgi:hypothetical protein
MDFNRDGLIYFNDCKMILVHMALSNECKLTTDRVMSKTDDFLKTVFPKTHMTLKDFRLSIEKKNSDLFFIMIFYLLVRNPFNDEILAYYRNDRRMEKLKKKVKWTEKVNVIKYTDSIKMFIGTDSYNKLTNNVETSVSKEGQTDPDEADLAILDEEYGISELYDLVVIPPINNPFVSKLKSSSGKQNEVILTNKDQSTEPYSLMYESRAGTKMLDMVFIY